MQKHKTGRKNFFNFLKKVVEKWKIGGQNGRKAAESADTRAKEPEKKRNGAGRTRRIPGSGETEGKARENKKSRETRQDGKEQRDYIGIHGTGKADTGGITRLKRQEKSRPKRRQKKDKKKRPGKIRA